MRKYPAIPLVTFLTAGFLITGCSSMRNPQAAALINTGWQREVSSAETSGNDDNWEKNFLNSFYSINLSNMDIKRETDLPDAVENKDGWCLEFADIPMAHIRAFGYMNHHFAYRGVLIEKDGILHYFPDVYYTSPALALPKTEWDESRQLLVMSCSNMTGAGVMADELFAFLLRGNDTTDVFSFAQADLERQIEQQITYRCSEEENEAYIYNRNGEPIGSEQVQGIEGRKITGINVLNMVTFVPGRDTILKTEIGLLVEGWMSPYYSDTPLVLSAPVQIEPAKQEGRETVTFTLGNLSLDKSSGGN